MTKTKSNKLPGQVILVMQGGGALGAFQAGVYEAMHEAGIEPEWVVGTSIGAINGAIIAGNKPANRLDRLREFWQQVASAHTSSEIWDAFGLGKLVHNLGAVSSGIPGFFAPNLPAHFGAQVPLGIANASYYNTAPLRDTLDRLVNFGLIAQGTTRLTLGAVHVASGRMRYFDSRDDVMGLEHVMASGALPPAFPAVEIEGEHYWDGGIYSNTPIEVVMDDNPRRDAVIFTAQLWQQAGDLPVTLAQVSSRMKDIQFSSRAESHTARQQQIHHLRHVVRELGRLLPAQARGTPEARELLGWGCGTVMHVLPMQAAALPGEDHTKDLDFTPSGIRERWNAGREFAKRKISEAPWNDAIDPEMGIVVHP
ncbi:MAG: patatin-like phospholipase family protein [Rhodoferax sp.]|uniref:patatin-like phospholipase family protein n=1 Tax=Rhodoferax sp. TaxID=50421 RepID=UPI00273032B1|nr:patatin-like phospholipase family protein [Rhodoferax sp.]MDP1531289.1 patatin-like phospholipase family protein [Rhodoferax sp.]MDP1942339.1 patatin-like phospholipase family protein [Rhodoferax sp.]